MKRIAVVIYLDQFPLSDDDLMNALGVDDLSADLYVLAVIAGMYVSLAVRVKYMPTTEFIYYVVVLCVLGYLCVQFISSLRRY